MNGLSERFKRRESEVTKDSWLRFYIGRLKTLAHDVRDAETRGRIQMLSTLMEEALDGRHVDRKARALNGLLDAFTEGERKGKEWEDIAVDMKKKAEDGLLPF